MVHGAAIQILLHIEPLQRCIQLTLCVFFLVAGGESGLHQILIQLGTVAAQALLTAEGEDMAQLLQLQLQAAALALQLQQTLLCRGE